MLVGEVTGSSHLPGGNGAGEYSIPPCLPFLVLFLMQRVKSFLD